VRRLADLPAFRMAASNRLALAFDPPRDGVPFTAGVEVFDPGHQTPRHTHATGCELFFVLAGTGVAHCDGASFALAPGDVVIFPPTCVHGLDADEDSPLVCLELLCPNDSFAERVRAGEHTGGLADEELCALAAVGCGGGP
jgi:quercetin dioxygenase-like cupin family protein